MTAGERKDTIEQLSLVAKHFNDMAPEQLSPVLGSLLQQKASTLITDYFSSGSSSSDRAVAVVRIVTEAVPLTSPTALFSPVVMHSFVSKLTQGVTKDNALEHGYFVPSEELPNFLKFSGALAIVCRWAIGSKRNKAALQGSALESLLQKALAALQQLSLEVSTQNVQLSSLHVVVDRPRDFLAMAKLADEFAGNTTVVPAQQLDNAKQSLEKFDLDLKAVQCFLTTYCNCGVPTEVHG